MRAGGCGYWLAVTASAPMFVGIHATEICVALPVMAGSFLSERTGSLAYARMGAGWWTVKTFEGGGCSCVMALEACAKRLKSAPRWLGLPGYLGRPFQRIIVAFLDPDQFRQPVQLKRCRPPRRVPRWPAVPPEQLLKCTLSERIQAEFLLGVRLRV